MTSGWQRWRRPLGIALLAILIPVVGVGWIIKKIQTPYQSDAWVSPDGEWRAWLERPEGSMEPMFYTLKVRRNTFFATPICDVASVSNWFAERYSRVAWPSEDHLRYDYGLSTRDLSASGAPTSLPIPQACAPLRIELRRDWALDAAATRENSSSFHYAIPVPDRSFPIAADANTTSPLN